MMWYSSTMPLPPSISRADRATARLFIQELRLIIETWEKRDLTVRHQHFAAHPFPFPLSCPFISTMFACRSPSSLRRDTVRKVNIYRNYGGRCRMPIQHTLQTGLQTERDLRAHFSKLELNKLLRCQWRVELLSIQRVLASLCGEGWKNNRRKLLGK